MTDKKQDMSSVRVIASRVLGISEIRCQIYEKKSN